jgi:hypothetical protein
MATGLSPVRQQRRRADGLLALEILALLPLAILLVPQLAAAGTRGLRSVQRSVVLVAFSQIRGLRPL